MGKRLGGGGFWRLEMRLRADVGVRGFLWGRVSAVERGEGGTPPPFKRFPGWRQGLWQAKVA